MKSCSLPRALQAGRAVLQGDSSWVEHSPGSWWNLKNPTAQQSSCGQESSDGGIFLPRGRWRPCPRWAQAAGQGLVHALLEGSWQAPGMLLASTCQVVVETCPCSGAPHTLAVPPNVSQARWSLGNQRIVPKIQARSLHLPTSLLHGPQEGRDTHQEQGNGTQGSFRYCCPIRGAGKCCLGHFTSTGGTLSPYAVTGRTNTTSLLVRSPFLGIIPHTMSHPDF